MTITATRLQALLGARYAIRHELGGGTLAAVFAADDLRHGRPVAIKLLRPEHATALAAERFDREIQIAARLQHPHIVPLLDSGEAGGLFYLVMPLIEGESLRARLVREGPLPVRDVLRIIADVADALAYAHQKGIIHRDIKPDNILLAGRHALVADFGVAKAMSEALGTDRNLTGGVALGTPAYMAPEQATADPALDHRVDLYALGILAYELLTGRPPFDGDTPHEVLTAQVFDAPVPVAERRPDTPPALAALVMRALQKDPAARWASADDLLPQIDGLATPSGGLEPVPAAPARAPRWGRWAAGLTLALAALVLAVRVVVRRVEATGLPRVTQRQLTFEGSVSAAAPSPEGSLLAYVAETSTGDELRVQDLRGGQPVRLAMARDIGGPSWSADGSEVRFDALDSTQRYAHYTVPRLGGATRRLGSLEGTALAPDGQWLALFPGGSMQLLLVSRATGDTIRRDLTGFLWHSDPALSPVAPKVAFTTAVPAERRYNVLVCGLPDLEPVSELQDSVPLGMPAWAPDGRRLYYLRTSGALSDLMMVRLSPRGRAEGPPAVVAAGLSVEPEYNRQLAASGDGRQVVYVRRERWSNLALVTLAARAEPTMERLLTMGSALYRAARLSPDGATIAYVRDRSDGMSLELQPVRGGASQSLAVRASILAVAWSPDGQRIAASVGEQSRVTGVEVFPVEGGEGRPYGGLRPGASIGWLGDSVVLVTGEGNRRLWRVPLAGGPPSLVPGVDPDSWVFFPFATPDGRSLRYYQNFGGGRWGISHLDLATGQLRLLQRGAMRLLHFDPEDRGVYFTPLGAPADSAQLWLAPGDGAAPRLVAAFPRGAEILDVDPVRAIVLLNLRDVRADAWAVELPSD